MKTVLISFLVILFLFFSFGQVRSQDEKSQLRKELVILNYSDPRDLSSVLRPFVSKDGELTWSSVKEGMITISDHPENVERILKLIKEIDVKPADILFTVQLILGSERGEEQADQGLQNDPIIRELKNLLKYKYFTLLDSNMLRTLDNEMAFICFGKDGDLRLTVQPRYVREEKEEAIMTLIRLDLTTSRWTQEKAGEASKSTSEERRLIDTHLSLKPEEKTVVGVSKLDGGDTGLILIITGKVIK